MNVLLMYFIRVIAIQAILYLIYVLAFHKSGRHAINRSYVILALVFSFTVPFVSVPNFQATEEFAESEKAILYEFAELTKFSTTETDLVPVERLNRSDFNAELIILTMSIVSILLLMKLIYSHIQLIRLKRQSEEMLRNGYKIYCSDIDSPFSYFNAVFIPKSLLDSSSIDTIMKHELVHIRKRHSLDRVFLEIISSIMSELLTLRKMFCRSFVVKTQVSSGKNSARFIEYFTEFIHGFVVSGCSLGIKGNI